MNPTIVIIDDTAQLAEMLADWFELSGFGVVGLSGPILAQELMLRNVAAVLLDMMLSNSQSGIEFAQQLRAQGYTGPLIAMSASDLMTTAAEQVGLFTLTLPKPFDGQMIDLIARISTLIEVPHA